MKAFIIASLIAVSILMLSRCGGPEVRNMKDLNRNMQDMMMYHDNLGLFLRKGDADYASWLLEGMDSGLKVVANKFDAHRKLEEPFLVSYKKELRPYIQGIRSSLKQNDFPRAIEQYRLLTKKCNDCHADNDVNEEVVDRSKDQLY